MNSADIQRLAGFLSAVDARSLEAISQELGCSHKAVWKHVENLRQLGIETDSVAGQGFLLREPLELLDRTSILDRMDPAIRMKISRVNIEGSLDSTNSAMQRLPVSDQHAAVILAEHQSSGRGRRGRQWHSPYARNLYLTLGWKFDDVLSKLGCLPLVVALATARALSRAGLNGHRVKWPNDLLLDDRKLCGCLVEMQGVAQGPCHAVLGVGINVHMPATELTAGIDQPWTDLHSQLPDYSRNALAALLLEELLMHLDLFSQHGFAPFIPLWQQLDGLFGKTISVYSGSDSIRGTANGIDEHGALMLDTGQQILSLYSGEVSLSPNKTEL